MRARTLPGTQSRWPDPIRSRSPTARRALARRGQHGRLRALWFGFVANQGTGRSEGPIISIGPEISTACGLIANASRAARPRSEASVRACGLRRRGVSRTYPSEVRACVGGRSRQARDRRTRAASQRFASRVRVLASAPCSIKDRPYVNTMVLFWCTRMRSSMCQRSAEASTRFSRSLPLRWSSSGVSRWEMRIVSCSMIGP